MGIQDEAVPNNVTLELTVSFPKAVVRDDPAADDCYGGAGRMGSGLVWHVAWGGTACEGQHVDISRACAESLGLPQGEAVILKALTDISGASSVSVEPANADDWEVISAQAAHIEDNLLNQVGRAKELRCTDHQAVRSWRVCQAAYYAGMIERLPDNAHATCGLMASCFALQLSDRTLRAC